MQGIETVTLVEKADDGKWNPSVVAADIATLSTGTLLAALVNTLLVFLIPRLVSIEDYGYWRLFGLYAGYVGFLHFGLADGALLRWVGRRFEDLHDEILPSLKFLVWQHIAVVVPLCLVFAAVLPAGVRFISIAVAAFALFYNPMALLQFSLQGARIFRPVAVSTVAPLGLFLGFVVLWRLSRPLDFRELIVLYFIAWAITLVFLLFRTKPLHLCARLSAARLGKSCILVGWPIVMANTGVAVIQCADRLAVSWAATIQNFAQYGLAASAMSVPITAIQASQGVLFSHLASLSADGRRRVYGSASRSLLLLWSLLLPYYLVLDEFVRHFLPKYVPSLGIARLLLLGIPFLGEIRILHMSFAYLHGRQKRFLIWTMTVLAVSLGLTSLAAFRLGTLAAVAAVQVGILGLWWLFNEWILRDLTGQTPNDWAKFLGVFAWVGLSYWVTMGRGLSPVASVVLYYVCISIILVVACRREVRLCVSLVVQNRGPLLGS